MEALLKENKKALIVTMQEQKLMSKAWKLCTC